MHTRRKTGSDDTAKATVAPYELKPGVLITFRPQSLKQAVSRLSDSAGIKNVAFAADFSQGVDMEQTRQAGMVVFNKLGVAVADVDPDQQTSIAAVMTDNSAIANVEREPIFFAFGDTTSPDFVSYLRGYRDAVNFIYDRAAGNVHVGPAFATAEQVAGFADNDEATWGLQATKVLDSRFTGEGIKVAVLDTGF